MSIRTVIITRPVRQAENLATRVSEAGFHPVVIPTIEIRPPAHPETAFAHLSRLELYRLIIFVSPNAIEQALSLRPPPWPTAIPLAVMGPGSRAALAEHGIAPPEYRIIVPRGGADEDDVQHDSESLFRQLDLDSIGAGPVMIVKGEGGRTWLIEELRNAGVQVDPVDTYQRGRPALEPEAKRLLEGFVSHNVGTQIVVTSTEGLTNLMALVREGLGDYGAAWLRRQPLIVPHPRIAENATARGFGTVVLTGAGDGAIVRALK